MPRCKPPLDILVVEDEAVLVMDLELMIEEAGHHLVADAACLQEVIDLDVSLMPHIAFVDMQLSAGSTGIEVAQLIRQRWSETCIVFVTANPMQIPDDYCGAHGVIPKPFTRLGMLSALEYLTQGCCDPPPIVARPVSFIPSPAIASSWSA